MGGLAVDTNEPGAEPHTHGSSRFIITIDGISLLAAHGQFPDMPLESILDESKVDNTAKTLTCVQAFWIVIQSIARVASGLPLTFLEINTLGLVKCAQFTFLFHA